MDALWRCLTFTADIPIDGSRAQCFPKSPVVGQASSSSNSVVTSRGPQSAYKYDAEDTRLHRFAAHKFLPDEVANDPQYRERFHR
jgi:hypothetical protein